MRSMVLIFLLLTGCAGRIYPTTTGSHAPGDPLVDGGPRQTYVIWSNHVGISHYLTGLLLQIGHTVVERSRVEQIFDEQRFRLVHSAEREADVLRIGAMAGANQVIFVHNESYLDRRQSVSLRSVDVESGRVRWTGTATVETTGLYVIDGAEQSLIRLAGLAIQRATCATERDRRWIDPNSKMPAGGCVSTAGR